MGRNYNPDKPQGTGSTVNCGQKSVNPCHKKQLNVHMALEYRDPRYPRCQDTRKQAGEILCLGTEPRTAVDISVFSCISD